jgi:ankyrin repeat protein
MSGGHWKEMFNAACEGDLALVEYHVKTGVDVNYAHPEFLSTPLVAAILARQEPVALYLLAHGANPELPSEFDGVTPMQAAHRVGLPQVVAKLHQMGVAKPPAPAAPKGWLEKWLAAKAKHWNKAWATKP